MAEHTFYTGSGDDVEDFVITTDGTWDNVTEIYSKSHDLCAELEDAGMGHIVAYWPGEMHPTMRIIPCLGRDGYRFFSVIVYNPDSVICHVD